jgi:hypothetical protein
MPRCTVCHHPQLLEINQAILSKDFTLAVLSQKYGLHPSSLQRHKNHIEVKMSRAHRRLREIREQGSLLLLNDILEQVRRNIAAADAQGNYLAVFRGSHVASRIIHQMGRLEGDMQPDTLHRLISSPAWIPGASLLPTDPGLIACLHQGLVDGAFVPCPEPPPEISGADPDEADDPDLAEPFLATGNSELETGLATLQRLLPDLDLTLDDISPEAEPEAKNQRKITEKSAANIPPDTDKCRQYHEDDPNEKNLPKNPESTPKTANAGSVGRESEAPAAVLTGDASLVIVAGNSAPAVMPATGALAPFSEILYYPYLSAPETINLKPRPVFSLPAADNSLEILPKPRAAGLATFLKKFASYAGLTRAPAPDPPWAPKTHVSATALGTPPGGPAVNQPSCTDHCPLAPDHCISETRGPLPHDPGLVSGTRLDRSPPPPRPASCAAR